MTLRLWLSVWASVSSSEKCESWYLPALRMFQESLPPSQLLTFSPQVGRGGQGSQRRERKGESQIAGRRAADLTRPTLAFAWTSPGYILRAGMEQGGQNWTCYGLLGSTILTVYVPFSNTGSKTFGETVRRTTEKIPGALCLRSQPRGVLGP